MQRSIWSGEISASKKISRDFSTTYKGKIKSNISSWQRAFVAKQTIISDPNGWRGHSSSTGTTYYTAEEISDPENAATIVLKHAAYSMSKS